MRSDQYVSGAVSADTRVNVTGNSGASVALNTSAAGNNGGASIYGGVMSGVYNQSTGATTITGYSHIEAPNGQAGDVDSYTQAVGNSQSFGISYGSGGLRPNQYNAATVTTDGGGVYGYVSGEANFNAVTSANDVTLATDNQSATRMIIGQDNQAQRTQASQFTAFGNVQSANTSAIASGNNVNALNEGPLLDIAATQNNQAYVRAQSSSAAYAFGSGAASAHGVGNSLAAGDVGGELVLTSDQLNGGGGIEAVAQFTGTEGYDGSATATAMGNSVTGFACSDCSGRLTVGNNQTNNVDVGAQSIVNVTATGRSANGVSNAIGNSATYYISRPGS